MARKRHLIKGYGYLVADSIELPMMIKAELKLTPQVLEWAKGSGPGTIKENLGDEIDGSLEYGAFDINAFANLIGGSVVAGSIRRVKQGAESHEIVTNTITLSNTPCTGTEFLYGDNGTRFKRVTSSPGVGEYTISGDTCTFSASETETDINPEYLYADASNGEKIVVPVSPTPDTFALYIAIDAKDIWASTGQNQTLVIYAASVTRTGELTLGGGGGEAGSFGFEFHVNNDTLGDLQISVG